MNNNNALCLALCLALSASVTTTAVAEPTAYTRYADFSAATPVPVKTLDFDTMTPGTTIARAGTTGDITFEYDFGGIPMKIAHLYATTSKPNFLGTSDGGMFHDGDNFTLVFRAGHAIGLFFITADPIFDGDLTLTAGGTTASLSAASIEKTLPDGSKVYFLGIVDSKGSFTRANVAAIPGGFFLFNVDDIVTAPSQDVATTASIDHERP
jgi:hypothetical protein